MMTAQRIQIGQVWRKVETGETFVVTKLYNEALATIAVQRPTGAATESMIRIRVDRQGGYQSLPGFSLAPENEGGERPFSDTDSSLISTAQEAPQHLPPALPLLPGTA